MSRRVLILGGGGHAKGLIEILRLLEPHDELAIADPRLELGDTVLGVSVIGGDDILAAAIARGYMAFAVGVGGVGDNRPRARLFDQGIAAGLMPLTVVHPSAMISPSAQLGPGAQCMPGAIIGANAVLGANVIINSGAIVEHDCQVDDHAHIATGAILAGAVHVEAFSHIGAGAIVRQGLSIGAAALVAAGAIVTKPVLAGTTVRGVAAQIMR
jgi:sugar O-acyltransferase (sialic acid O-acetyltransferase NeuD family)